MQQEQKTPQTPVTIFTRAERNEIRRNYSLFGKFNSLWDDSKMNATKKVGRVMDIVVQARAKTQKEFQDYYMHNFHRWEEIRQWGQEWAEISCLPEDIALAHIIIHIFDQTWDGYVKEEDVLYYLDRHPDSPFAGRAFRPDYDWDKVYAIDIAIRDYEAEHGFIDCYQIKPPSFFANKKIGWHKEKIAKDHRGAEELGLRPMFLNHEDVLKHNKFRPIHWTEVVQ